MTESANYFLVSVSNRENLELCLRHSMAGFTSSVNGLWTFLDISEGDYISFLYGARVKNLYRVVRKLAFRNAESLPPWPPVTFKMSGKTYYFPFRLFLQQERDLDEPMIRPEFAFVAENLLLRGGYRRTHFQADAVTFYNVSNMGTASRVAHRVAEPLHLGDNTFTPEIVFARDLEEEPLRFHFKELILQSLVRRKLSDLMPDIIRYFGLDYDPDEFEILGEKALPEGYVDIFIKLKHPVGSNKYILVEIKTGNARMKDMEQLQGYLSEFKNEAVGGILVAKGFPRRGTGVGGILPLRYSFESLDAERRYTYDNLLRKLKLELPQP